MDTLEISRVKISGIVACLPEIIKDNKEACAELLGDNVSSVIKATGIKYRCIADAGTTSLDLDVAAAKQLLEYTSTIPNQIGAVICVTFTPEYIMPADATVAQYRLGIPKHTMAFDINMACSGYGYGLYIAASLVNALGKKVLLLNGDIQSAYLSGKDKSTIPVMSDIGTATLLEPNNGAKKWKFSFYTDGSGREVLFIPAGGAKRPVQMDDLNYKEDPDGNKRRDVDIYMDGFEVYRFVAKDASKFIMQFMENNGLSLENIDAFIPHQANMYMIDQLAKKLKFNPDKVWKSGDIYGNPGSASIPLTIAYNANEWFPKEDKCRILISGFGAGLSVSVASLTIPGDAYFSVIRIGKGKKANE